MKWPSQLRPTTPAERVAPVFVIVALVVGLVGPTRFGRAAVALVRDPAPAASIIQTAPPPQPREPAPRIAPAAPVDATAVKELHVIPLLDRLERENAFQGTLDLDAQTRNMVFSWTGIPTSDIIGRRAYTFCLARVVPPARLTAGVWNVEGAYHWKSGVMNAFGGPGSLKLELKEERSLVGWKRLTLPVPPATDSARHLGRLEVLYPTTVTHISVVSEPHTGEGPSSGEVTITQLALVRDP